MGQKPNDFNQQAKGSVNQKEFAEISDLMDMEMEIVLATKPFDVSTKGVKKHRKWIRPFHAHGILITYQKNTVEGRELRAAMVWHQGKQTYFGPKRDAETWWQRCRRM